MIWCVFQSITSDWFLQAVESKSVKRCRMLLLTQRKYEEIYICAPRIENYHTTNSFSNENCVADLMVHNPERNVKEKETDTTIVSQRVSKARAGSEIFMKLQHLKHTFVISKLKTISSWIQFKLKRVAVLHVFSYELYQNRIMWGLTASVCNCTRARGWWRHILWVVTKKILNVPSLCIRVWQSLIFVCFHAFETLKRCNYIPLVFLCVRCVKNEKIFKQ